MKENRLLFSVMGKFLYIVIFLKKICFFYYYFFRDREHKWEGQKEMEREYQAESALSAEPDTRLNLTTMTWATTKSPMLNQQYCTGPLQILVLVRSGMLYNHMPC